MQKDHTYDELRQLLSSYISEEQLLNVDSYYEKAKEVYNGLKRKTGEDYINHSIRVAYMLAELKMDYVTIGSALIHEAITLEKMTREEVEELFGEETATILSSITKLSHLKKTFKHDNDTEKYRRIVVGLSENPKALFIKLADRLDNLRTVYVHDDEHKKEIIEETTNVFIPIAHRLGIKTMKSELEDLCLRYSKPVEYQEVLDKISADKNELEGSLKDMKEEIIELLNDHDIKFDILSRVKSVRGVYNKLAAGKKWNDIYDLLGLRILVDKTEECYLVIGLIHSKYKPIPKRFKDYIANPKNNMYQSLHTTVFGVDGRMYEVQVRTHEMDEIAEHGVASHWSYKEKTDGSKKGEVENKLEAFRTLIELNDIEGNIDFFNNLDTNLNKEEIYVFTPKGDIIELPVGSTPIDFAYKIHSEVGNTCVSAIVNGKIRKLDYKLHDSDIVELKTQAGTGPSKSWLDFVKTDQAKSRIKSYFYKQDKERLIKTGEELLINEIKKRKYSPSDLLKPDYLSECIKSLKVDDEEELYMGISSLKYSPNIVVNKLIQCFEPKENHDLDKLLNNSGKTKGRGSVLIAGYDDLLTNISSCCMPVYGEEIVGFITRGHGISIHRSDCPNVDLNSERIVKATWNDEQKDKFTTSIHIYIDGSNEKLIDIITAATKVDVNIVSINYKKKTKDGDFYEIICKVKDINTLNLLMVNLQSLKFVNKIERGITK